MLGKLIYEVSITTPDINANGFVFWARAQDFRKNLECEFAREELDLHYNDDGLSLVFKIPVTRETNTDEIDARIQKVIADFVEEEARLHPRDNASGAESPAPN